MGCLLDNSKSFKIIPAMNKKLSSRRKKTEIKNNRNISTNVIPQVVNELITRLSKISSVASLEIPGLLRAALCVGRYHSNCYNNNNSINEKNVSTKTNNKTNNNRIDINNIGKTSQSHQIFIERNVDDIMAVTSLWKAVLTIHDSLIIGTKTLHSHLLLDSLKSLLWLTQSVSLNPDKIKVRNVSNGQNGGRNSMTGPVMSKDDRYHNSNSKNRRNFDGRKEQEGGDEEGEGEGDEDNYQWLAVGDRVRRAIPLLRLAQGMGLSRGSEEVHVLARSLATAVFERSTHPIAMTTQILDIRYTGLISKEISTKNSPRLSLNMNTDQEQEQEQEQQKTFRSDARLTETKNVCIYHYSRASMRLLVMTGQHMVELYPHISNVNMMDCIWSFVSQFTIPISTIGYADADHNVGVANKKNNNVNHKNNSDTDTNNMNETVSADTGAAGKIKTTPSKAFESTLSSLLDFSSPSPTKSNSSSSTIFGTNFDDNLTFPSLEQGDLKKSRVGAEIEAERVIHNILKFSLSWALDISLSDCKSILTYNRTNRGSRPTLTAEERLEYVESAEALKVLKQHALWHLADNVRTYITEHFSCYLFNEKRFSFSVSPSFLLSFSTSLHFFDASCYLFSNFLFFSVLFFTFFLFFLPFPFFSAFLSYFCCFPFPFPLFSSD